MSDSLQNLSTQKVFVVSVVTLSIERLSIDFKRLLHNKHQVSSSLGTIISKAHPTWTSHLIAIDISTLTTDCKNFSSLKNLAYYLHVY